MAVDTTEKFKSFPNPQASESVKASDEYGIEYARAIFSQYNQNNGNYLSRKQRDIISRKYAEGLESIDKYKDRLDLKGDTSYLNLDFNPVNIIATRVDNMVGRLTNQEYKIQCNPIDPSSKVKLDDDRKRMYANMFLKQNGADDFEKTTGVPLVPKNEKIPETDEEMELHFKLNYKQDASIAMEEGLDFVFSNNDWKEHEKQIIKDLIVIKKGAAFLYYDEQMNICAEHADPNDIITPYSKYDDFRNIPYVALVKQYTIQEISQQTNKFNEEQLWDIAKSFSGNNQNPQWNWGNSYEGYYPNIAGYSSRPYDNFNISVLRFFYLCVDKKAYISKKPSEKTKFSRDYFYEKKEGYKVPEKSKFNYEEIENSTKFCYGGNWIVGSKYIYEYGKTKNIPREKVKGGYSPDCMLPLIMVYPDIRDMENKSLVERMIPHEDQINLIHLKSQQLLIKARPPGVAIDLEGIEGAIKGMGDSTMKPIEITKMYDQTGSYIYRSRNENGEIINPRVITPLDNGIARDFLTLFQAYNNEVEKLNTVIGYNNAVDSSTPNKDALVGVQKLAALASNNSLRSINSAFVRIVEKTAYQLSLMIQDSIEFDNKAFTDAIGGAATKTLSYGKKIALNQFGIKIEFLPNEAEKADIVLLLNLGIQNQTLTSSDVVLVKEIMKQNVKLAAQMLVYREGKNRENKQKESMMLQQQNGQVQQQSAQMAAQSQAQVEQVIAQTKAQLLQAEYELKSKLSAQEFMQDMKKIEAQNAGKAVVQQISNAGKEAQIIAQHETDLLHTAFEISATPASASEMITS